MSRGPGRLQRIILSKLADRGEPMTFEQIMGPPPDHGCGFHPYLIRSVRRALRKLIDDGRVLGAGVGGPRSPHRYFIHPIVHVNYGGIAAVDAAIAALDPEAREAFDEDGRRVAQKISRGLDKAMKELEVDDDVALCAEP